jgi:hypothetical protein
MDRQATARPTIRYLITNNCEGFASSVFCSLALCSMLQARCSLLQFSTSFARVLVQKLRTRLPPLFPRFTT